MFYLLIKFPFDFLTWFFFRISFWIASHDFQYKLKIAHNYRYFKQSKVGGGVQSFFTPWFILLVNDWVQKTLLVLKSERCFFPEQIQNETTNFQLCLKHIINLCSDSWGDSSVGFCFLYNFLGWAIFKLFFSGRLQMKLISHAKIVTVFDEYWWCFLGQFILFSTLCMWLKTEH